MSERRWTMKEIEDALLDLVDADNLPYIKISLRHLPEPDVDNAVYNEVDKPERGPREYTVSGKSYGRLHGVGLIQVSDYGPMTMVHKDDYVALKAERDSLAEQVRVLRKWIQYIRKAGENYMSGAIIRDMCERALKRADKSAGKK